jgi:hypothetical protein
LPWFALKRPELPIASECRALSEAAPLTRVDAAELDVRAYNSAALRDLARDENRVTLSLHRAAKPP